MRLEIHDHFIALVPETPQDVSHMRALGYPNELGVVHEPRSSKEANGYMPPFRLVLRRLIAPPTPPTPPTDEQERPA